MGRVDHKTALVTGGASGLGKIIAQRLASEGARVVITDVQADLGRETAKKGGFTFLEQDVRDEARWSEVVAETEQRFNGLHIVVNNAGIVGAVDAFNVENTRLKDWQLIFAVNVEGVFLGCRTAVAALRRSGGGSIINMSSIAALTAMPWGTAYGAAKAAVRHITRSVALYCAQDGSKIRCNSVHPGNVLTPLLENTMAGIAKSRGVPYETVYNEFKNECPLKDFQKPEDIANVVLFLGSDESQHMTGVQMIVDGGTTLLIGPSS